MAIHYRERVLPGPIPWIVGLGFVAMVSIAYGAAVGAAVGWIVAVCGLAIVIGLVWVTSPTIQVTDDNFRIGSACLPLSAIRHLQVVPPGDLPAVRDADARAYLALRPLATRNSIKIDLDDPTDPHPYWLVSTRRPTQLTATLGALTTGQEA